MSPRDPVHIGGALHQAASPLLRQIRKQQAYKAFLAALPEELLGLCAPTEIRLAPRREHGQFPRGRQAEAGGAEEGADAAGRADGPRGGAATPQAQCHTLFVLCTNATVASVVEQQAPGLIETVNAALPFAMVEAIATETTPLARIERQLNILSLRPD
jgi:hypothetical protein